MVPDTKSFQVGSAAPAAWQSYPPSGPAGSHAQPCRGPEALGGAGQQRDGGTNRVRKMAAGRGGSGRNLKLLLLLVQLALRAHASKHTNLGKVDCIFTVRVQCLHGYLKKASVHSLNNEILQCPGVDKFQLPQQSRIGNYLIQHLNFRL